MIVRMTMTMKKINSRCRLCASEEGFGSFSNIFDENSQLELEVKIAKLLPVVVTPWDTMPHVVCPECIGKLNSFNDFFEASLKAEELLKSLEPSVWGSDLENVMESPKKQEERSEVVGGEHDERPKRTLECFIVNRITPKESVYTCRHCYRTYTKQSSALTHPCVELDDCREEEEEKSLPPLKIRLFSIKSGLFVCYLCQMQFEEKTSLVEHIKSHFVDGKWGIRKKKKKRRGGHGQEENNEEESWKEVYAKRKKKRKKSTDSLKKKDSRKPGDSVEECENLGEGQNSVPKNTTEEAAVTCGPEVTYEVQVAGPTRTTECKAGNKSDEEGGGSSSDEVTVLEVIYKKTPFFSACVFCDKVFATKEALVAHQNRHILGYPGQQAENVQTPVGDDSNEGTTLCGVCGMGFTNSATLLHHLQYHVVQGHG